LSSSPTVPNQPDQRRLKAAASAAILGVVLQLTCAAPSAFAQGVADGQVHELVRIPAEDIELNAAIYRPAGPGPHPAVIALHGCGGLFSSSALRPSARHDDWGRRLAAQGFLVVMPDSFGSRGLGSQCGVVNRTVRSGRERVADVSATRTWLQKRTDVKPASISLIGWSNGGSTVLAAVRADRKPGDTAPDIARAVAFYPGCRVQAEALSFRARVPLLILIGEADDWTPAGPCVSLTRAAELRGEPVEIKTYPDAFHDFDHPNREVAQRGGLAFAAGRPSTETGGGTATVGTNEAARNDALARVPAFLAR
jgi:dienelactone hydrolase